MKTSVVLPAYNEELSIAELLRSIRSFLPDCELVVVDDCSTDNTARIAEHEGARVIRHPYNMGNGAAVKSGIRNATGDILVLMDADGQHNPQDIQTLLSKSSVFDMVVGARNPSSQAGMLRRIANTVYNFLASYVTRRTVADLTSGFRVVHRKTVLRYLFLLPNTFSYPTTITLAYMRSGRSVCYVPIEALRRKGKSKINLPRDGIHFLLIIIKISTLFSPLHIFIPVSLLFFLLGLINYAYTYVTVGRFTNMSALLFISSVFLFMMGLISEQITQLRYDRMEDGG